MPRPARRGAAAAAAAASSADQEQIERQVRDALDAVREALKAERPRNSDLRNALRDITDAIHKDPANANCYAERARLYVRLGEPKLALFDLTMAIQMEEPSGKDDHKLAGFYGARGQCFRHLGKLEDSLCDFKRAKHYQPENGQWLYEMGVSFCDLGDKWRALEMFSLALGDAGGGAAAAASSSSPNNNNSRPEGSPASGTGAARFGAVASSASLLSSQPQSYGGGGNNNRGDGAANRGPKLRREERINCLVYRGNTYRELGALNESVEDLRRAVELEPESASHHNVLGLSYFEQADYRSAAAMFAKAVELDPNNSIYHNNLGLANFQQGQHSTAKYAEAHDSFRTAVALEEQQAQQNPTTYDKEKGRITLANMYFNKGNAALSMDQIDNALDDFDQAIAKDPEDENIYHAKGIAYQNTKPKPRIDAAIQQFQKALALNPTFKPSLFHMGLMYHSDNKPFKAMDCFAQVAKADPTDRRAFENIGLVYCDLLYFDLAVGAFTRAIDILPTNAVMYFYRGKALLWLGRYEAAAADFNRAVELGCEEPQVYNNRALSYKYQKRYGDAIQDLSKAISITGTEVEFWYNRAMCYAETGQYAKAVGDLTEALKVDNTQHRLFFLRGKCAYLMGKYSEALVDLRHARAAQPNAPDAPEAFYYMGLSHARLDEYAHALQNFSEAVARKPNCAHYVHERAKALQHEGRHEEAVQDFTKVLALQPLNAHALFRRAFAFKSINRFAEAAEDFENARKLAPLNPHLVVNYKKVYEIGFVELCSPGDEPPYEEQVAVAEAARATAHVR